MRFLLTGAQGFLGRILSEALKSHEIWTLGNASLNDISIDLASSVPRLDKGSQIDVVIHSAGKAHVVPTSSLEARAFFDVNVQGTRHLLDSIQGLNTLPTGFVFISTVSVYGLQEGTLLSETQPLNGTSPYANSKISSEEVVINWCTKQNVRYLILRLPLVVGPHPKGNLAKMIDGMRSGRYVRIAKGQAQKSMVLGADVAILIERWATQSELPSGIYNLTDGYHPTFFELEEALRVQLGKPPLRTIPTWLARSLGRVGDLLHFFPVNSATIQKITCTFTFSDQKAVEELGWSPRPVLEHLDFITP